jgi:predicted NBD/HSP70 family sugar kinase
MIVVADIGGSNMRVAVSDARGILEEPFVCDTPADFDTAVAIFAKTARNMARGRPITGAAVGVAGILSRNRRALLKAPHLRGWENKNIADAFESALGVPIRFENDAALGALGEAVFGAGSGVSILAYIAVGTGVGGARVVDGKIDRTTFGFEMGHMKLGVGADAPEWEELVSGSGLGKKYGKPSSEIKDLSIWNECADAFALGLYNTILHWSPERIVLGGALFNECAIPLARVKITLHSINTALPILPEIRLSKLGDKSVLYGALTVATVS